MAAYDLEEQDKLADLKAYWAAKGGLITALVTAACVVVIGLQSYRWYNKTQAEKALAKAISDYERGTLTTMNRTTVKEFADRWMQRHKGKSQNTLDKYQRELNYILEIIGGVKLKDLKAGHIKDALSALADSCDLKV